MSGRPLALNDVVSEDVTGPLAEDWFRPEFRMHPLVIGVEDDYRLPAVSRQLASKGVWHNVVQLSRDAAEAYVDPSFLPSLPSVFRWSRSTGAWVRMPTAQLRQFLGQIASQRRGAVPVPNPHTISKWGFLSLFLGPAHRAD